MRYNNYRIQTSILEELDAKYGDNVEFKVVEVDENPGLASRYNINTVPASVIQTSC